MTESRHHDRELRRQREAEDLRIARAMVAYHLEHECGFWGIVEQFPNATLRQFALALELAAR